MSAEPEEEARLEIGHVLFTDIVGYSKLLTNEQRELLNQLNQIVRDTAAFRAAEAAGKLVRLPTGDGMALAFFTSPDAPVRCALEISRSLASHPQLYLRMGIHSGPVDHISDVNDRPNIAGSGVNIAQRVMDCGDAGHILLSARAADDLAQYGEWKPQLHDLGEIEVKHGVRVRVASLHGDGVGNAEPPQKLRRQRVVRRRRVLMFSAVQLVLGIALALGVWLWQRQAKLRLEAAAQTAARVLKSVAVLPFESLSTDEQNAVLAGGMHREVLSNLAKIADLKVISRTSVMRYKPGVERKLKEIAEELGVAYVVEGSVQRAEGKVRVTAELIEASSDSQLWGETFDGDATDVLRIQSEIAQRISNQLGARLSPQERADLASRPTADLAAFESYIRARALMETLEVEPEKLKADHTRAVQLLEQAVARDPQFVVAYWALSEANIQLFRNELTAAEYRTQAEAALKEAERLSPEAGETIYARARVRYYGYSDFEGALATLEEAAKRLPNNAEISLTRGLLYRRFGRWQEAYAQFIRATELNPQDASGYLMGAQAALALRWWDDTDRVRERMLKVIPRLSRQAQMEKAISLRLRGDIEAGNRELEKLNPDVRQAFWPLFLRAFFKRDHDEARRLINEAAKYPHLARERWEGEVRLALLANSPVDREAALAAEESLETGRQGPSSMDPRDVLETLACVKTLLGKKEEAVRLRQENVQKHPISEDALANVGPLRGLAYGYAMVGDRERALQALAHLVQVPGATSYAPLKFDPLFDALREDPRFDPILKQAQQPFPRP